MKSILQVFFFLTVGLFTIAAPARASEKTETEHWHIYTGRDDKKPHDLFVTAEGGDRVKMRVVRKSGPAFEMTGIRSATEWTARYDFPDLETFKNEPWVDVETKGKSTIPDAVFVEAFQHRPYETYSLKKAPGGSWQGKRLGPGFRWSGGALTEYRMDSKEIRFSRVAEFKPEDKLLTYWDRCRIEVVGEGTAPDLWLVRISYRESALAASLLATRYPITVLKKGDTGKFRWSLDDKREEIIHESQAGSSEEIRTLKQLAEKFSGKGWFPQEQTIPQIDKLLDSWTGIRTALRNNAVNNLKSRLRSELNKPGAGLDGKKLSKKFDNAVDEWLKQYTPEHASEHFTPDAYSSEGWKMTVEKPLSDSSASTPKPATENKSQSTIDQYGMPSDQLHSRPVVGQNGTRKTTEKDTSDVLKEYAPGGSKSYDTASDDTGPYSNKGWDFKLAEHPETVRQNIEEQIVKELDKSFPECRSVYGTEGMKDYVAKIAKIISEGNGSLNSLSPAQMKKMEKVMDDALNKALSKPPSPGKTNPIPPNPLQGVKTK